MVRSYPRTQRDCAADKLDRPLWIPLLKGHHAQQMMGIGILGVVGDQDLVDPRCVIQTTLLMILKRRAQSVFHEVDSPVRTLTFLLKSRRFAARPDFRKHLEAGKTLCLLVYQG